MDRPGDKRRRRLVHAPAQSPLGPEPAGRDEIGRLGPVRLVGRPFLAAAEQNDGRVRHLPPRPVGGVRARAPDPAGAQVVESRVDRATQGPGEEPNELDAEARRGRRRRRRRLPAGSRAFCALRGARRRRGGDSRKRCHGHDTPAQSSQGLTRFASPGRGHSGGSRSRAGAIDERRGARRARRPSARQRAARRQKQLAARARARPAPAHRISRDKGPASVASAVRRAGAVPRRAPGPARRGAAAGRRRRDARAAGEERRGAQLALVVRSVQSIVHFAVDRSGRRGTAGRRLTLPGSLEDPPGSSLPQLFSLLFTVPSKRTVIDARLNDSSRYLHFKNEFVSHQFTRRKQSKWHVFAAKDLCGFPRSHRENCASMREEWKTSQ